MCASMSGGNDGGGGDVGPGLLIVLLVPTWNLCDLDLEATHFTGRFSLVRKEPYRTARNEHIH